MSDAEQSTQDRARRARRVTVNWGGYHRLSIFLSMDFGVVVLFRHNRTTGRPTCIWADGPTEEIMRCRAWTYSGKIGNVDIARVDWVRSGVLLAAVNRARDRRPALGEGREYS